MSKLAEMRRSVRARDTRLPDSERGRDWSHECRGQLVDLLAERVRVLDLHGQVLVDRQVAGVADRTGEGQSDDGVAA